jgi:hypothetical protein
MVGPDSQVQQRGPPEKSTQARARTNGIEGANWRMWGPGLPPGIPVMHTIHNPRKTVMNQHNRVGITEYNIHYINKSLSLT